MAKIFLFLSALGGFFSVVLGAFGAHALKAKLDDYHLSVFQTGVDYQFFHSLALGLVGLILLKMDTSLLKTSGWSFLVGIIIFSGSLYILAFTGQRFWGAITPIGGVSFLVGWACLAWSALKL